ncbi:TonB-dependent receptor [Rhodocytophaga aerolata]|uniref:TonB-dependent receptor n=1 Tax=Rhodocytophaga aerolata TaxID=455078 RepID=A0ABT8R9C0_9BACT|nr:TonB-dependent receptor [Rhodocytophaga aerolata]MDO1448686.1 TonB-dependent receptor [Rhodocytophaga aerolata]
MQVTYGFWGLLLGILLLIQPAYAQQAVFQGKVLDKEGVAIVAASVRVLELSIGVATDTAGNFRMQVPAGKAFTYVFSHIGYQEKRYSFTLTVEQVFDYTVRLTDKTRMLSEVEVKSGKVIRLRPEISITKIDPQNVKTLPSAFGDFNKMLSTLPGVVSNNELSSSYSVRGGNFDENLVYVNGIEVYRPFLARSGQQEGLSFVNPDLVQDVEFSSGGWQAKYGDKLSSVLNILYKEPEKTSGSLTVGLLGGAAHVQGISNNKRIAYVAGVRQKQSQYLLGTLDVKGEYLPSFTDVQSYITLDLSKRKSSSAEELTPKTSIGILLSYARNRYFVKPVSRETSFGTREQILKLFVAFQGQELLNYDMYQNGVKFTHQPNRRLTLNILASAMQTSEREYLETDGYYRLCDVDVAIGSNRFNECIATRGTGGLYTHARNKLRASILTIESRNRYELNVRNSFEWGAKIGHERISDILDEYSFTDSADYVRINELLYTDISLRTWRYSAYAQHTFLLNPQHTITYGFRLGYWNLNKQFLVSPTAQYSYKPGWEKPVIFKLAAGIYRQPPFYRELRSRTGQLTPSLKAQSSLHLIAGAERILKLWNRDFLLTTELYYKSIWDAVAYDVENVRIRYFANNNTKAYAMGADVRLSGEFIKGAESWFSMGILNTREDLGFDTQGFVRRPTDQRLTFGAFFQDHLPRNPTIRVYLNLIFGTGLPFSPPQTLQYRSSFTAPPYRRLDMGFSKVITIKDRSKGLGKYTESIWLGAEVLNVIGAQNTISYTWITDIQNRQYAVPNRLSARFINVRVIARFDKP